LRLLLFGGSTRLIEFPSEIGQFGLGTHRSRAWWARGWCESRTPGLRWLRLLLSTLILLLILWSWEPQEWFGCALEGSARSLLYDKLTYTDIGRH
jgi:hypothetical protein